MIFFCPCHPPVTLRYYTIRYRERNRKWIYQTCPTSDTVIDNLKPNTPYEFGVRSNKDDRRGSWSKPVVHNTNMGGEGPLSTGSRSGSDPRKTQSLIFLFAISQTRSCVRLIPNQS